MSDEAPLLLAVDGDGLLFRAFHGIGSDGETDAFGRPVAALRGLLSFVAAAAARLQPQALLVGFDSRVDPVRKALFADYKGHRPPKPVALQSQLDDAPALLAAAGLPAACIGGYEADDVLASACALARAQGWRTVLVTSDRDSFALVDATTSVLRVGEGGIDGAPLLGPDDVERLYGVPPHAYRDFAALRGDASDNLRGVYGIGAKNSAKLIAAFGSVAAVYEALDGGRRAEIVALIGEACTARLDGDEGRVLAERNCRLMAMHADLPLPDLDALRLPVDRERVVKALRAKGIGLGRSLWALVGDAPPPWQPNGFDSAPAQLPGHVAPGWRDRVMPSWEELRRVVELPDTADARPVVRPVVRPVARPARRVVRVVPAGQETLF